MGPSQRGRAWLAVGLCGGTVEKVVAGLGHVCVGGGAGGLGTGLVESLPASSFCGGCWHPGPHLGWWGGRTLCLCRVPSCLLPAYWGALDIPTVLGKAKESLHFETFLGNSFRTCVPGFQDEMILLSKGR